MSSIKKIILEVGGVELSLSPEDAKTLQAALNELFPTKKEIQFIPQSVPVPYPVYPRPWRWYEYDSGLRFLSATQTGSATRTLNLNSSSIQMLAK